MAKRTERAPRKSPGKSPGALVVPSHGGGLIRRGSLPGNTPGTGRPPDELRARMRGSLDQRMHVAEEVLDDPRAAVADRLRALEFLAKYGLGTTTTTTDTKGNDPAPGRLSPEQKRSELHRLLGDLN
jgi:hypothetical protein